MMYVSMLQLQDANDLGPYPTRSGGWEFFGHKFLTENVQNMTGCSEMKKVPIFAKTKNINNKICHWPDITVNSLIIGMYCQNPIYPNNIIMLYNNNYIISQSLFSPRCGGDQKRPKLENSFEEKLLHRWNWGCGDLKTSLQG